ncbi:hypothetical protein QBC43DRAFT_41905 [Cladorrhinum sp. PSN259]|nr:hypothetical protein QBC43DRAFT_41905 [Cladorrhinum sp. PSN259]
MASRSDSLFARRPPADDPGDRRRSRDIRDFRDERPRDSSRDRLQRRGSYRGGDEHREKGYRRDDSPPTRRYPSDSPRDPSFSHPSFRPEAPRPDDSVRPKTSTSSHSLNDGEIKKPDAPVSADKAKAAEVAKALKKYGDSVKDSARLKLHQEIMEKNLKQRERDYIKSNHQNAPYPSVVELQNKYRSKLDRDVKDLQEALHKAEAKETDAISSFVKFFTGRVPTFTVDSPDSSKVFETKLASLESILQQQQEAHMKALKDQEEKETRLQQLVQEIQTERKTQKLEFEYQIQTMQEHFSKQMLEMQKGFDKKLGETRAQNADDLAKHNKQQHIEFTNRVGKLMETVKGQKTQSQSTRDDLRKELKGELAEELQNGLSAHSERLAGFEKQLRDIKLNPGKDAVSWADLSSVTSAVTTLENQTTDRVNDLHRLIDGLQANLADCAAQTVAEDLNTRLRLAEDKLAQVDIEAVEAATEMASFGFPDLKDKVDNMQSSRVESRVAALETSVNRILLTQQHDNDRLDDAETNIDTIHHQVTEASAGMQNLTQKMNTMRDHLETRATSLETQITTLNTNTTSSLGGLAESFGKIINDLRGEDGRLGARVSTLEKKAGEQTPAPVQVALKRTATAARLTSPDAATSPLRLDSALKLNKDLAALMERIENLESTVRQQVERLSQLEISNSAQVLEDLQAKVEMVKFGVESLDDRFNNLTTKHLAEHLIGTLQQLCPNEAQLKADIDFLKKLIQKLESRVQEYTGKVEKVDDNMNKMMLDLQGNRNFSEDGLNKGSVKKRKLDSSPNGNGSRRSVSNGLQ